MRKYNLLGIFLLGFLLISTSFGLVAAEDEEEEDDIDDGDLDDDGVDDEVEEENKRDIEIEFSDNEFQIESHLRNGDIVNEIKLKVKYDDDDGVSIKVSYEEEVEEEGVIESEESTEFELEFKVEFRELIEFVDLDANGIFDDSIDQLIQEYAINSFNPVIYTTSIISNDTTLHYVIVNTTDGVFTVHIFFVEEFTVVNDTFISPTQTKIDIEITDFNYLDDNSQLALYIKLESEVDYEEDDNTEDEDEGNATEEDGVIIDSNGFSGIFTWKENALIDGVLMDVLSNTLEVDDDDELEQKLILNYPRGNHIYHDPKVGISFGQPTTSMFPIVLSGSIIAIIGIAAVVVVIANKRRKL